MEIQRVPFKITPVKGWTLSVADRHNQKFIAKVRIFDSGGWEISGSGYNNGGHVRWLPEDVSKRNELMAVLDDGKTYPDKQPFAKLFGGWPKPLISLGPFLTSPPQPWFSHTGIRHGLIEFTHILRAMFHDWKLQ